MESSGQPNNSCGLSLLEDKKIHFPGQALLSHTRSISVRCGISKLPPASGTSNDMADQRGNYRKQAVFINIKTTVKASQPGEWLQIQECHGHFWKEKKKRQMSGTREVPEVRNSVKGERQLLLWAREETKPKRNSDSFHATNTGSFPTK